MRRRIREVIHRTPGSDLVLAALADGCDRPRSGLDLLMAAAPGPGSSVLDLGCGEGKSARHFPPESGVLWRGVDIAQSPEVAKRQETDHRIDEFDGLTLPYPGRRFDIILCQTVLEHVRYPDRLLPEAARVLKPGGLMVGDVAFLYPYHSYSIFNYTPYGLVRVLQESGFSDIRLHPTWDTYLSMARLVANRSRWVDWLARHSPVFAGIRGVGRLLGLTRVERAYLQLQFAGVFAFSARVRDEDSPPP